MLCLFPASSILVEVGKTFLQQYLIIILVSTPFFAFAQKKDKDTPKDTVIIINDAVPAEQKKIIQPSSSNMKETVIIIKPYDTLPKQRPTYKDTVIVIKKGLTKEQLANKEKAKEIEIRKQSNFCSCVKMDIETPEVLQYNTYLNYKFIFKNTCKLDIWVSSKHFRYQPIHASGRPVKVLRKLSFVERFNYPDFVKIAPGETFTFDFSDDAFFEYDLKKGEAYKFTFEHRNFGDRSKRAAEKTYLCGQQRVKLIMVQ